MKKKYTLIFIYKDNKILLGLKKRGFALGKYTLVGGKVELGETIEEGAQREVFEESNLDVRDLKKVAVLDFAWPDKKNPDMEVHLFKTNNFSGQLADNDEISPSWFEIDKLPYKKMLDDNKYWFPLVLKDQKFQAQFLFDKHDKVIEHSIKIETP